MSRPLAIALLLAPVILVASAEAGETVHAVLLTGPADRSQSEGIDWARSTARREAVSPPTKLAALFAFIFGFSTRRITRSGSSMCSKRGPAASLFVPAMMASAFFFAASRSFALIFLSKRRRRGVRNSPASG